ncbi:hypothetical protein DWQ65_08900 [Treponema phagedenis]|uniref:Uncharacterized protein n=1 Tax=Treponema phagedenis TaxID=162 RepID=A0AAE6M960_TREPH|nr:hypothetical protein FUT79_02450 [Treponema phagedenis]QEJ99224.1 hypothetical protein FUT82_15340 [Treponema phagedenis]QEK00150.1 hypothetical protein FUT84_02410 [Treponema phagedenis]QEK04790.1 hypothetical protein FUT83_13965 [Treponema phagedenis]QEK07643.1 hypothetical protein FUT80_13525 [Treponema phagedenis]
MVNCPPLPNSKRCFKASTQKCKIEAFKLAGLFLPRTAKLRTGTDARGSTQTVWFLTWTSKIRTAMDGSGSKQKRRFKAKVFVKLTGFSITMVNCPPLRRVGLFFIKFFPLYYIN